MGKNIVNLGYTIALILLLASMFILSPSLTGNLIGNIERSNANLLSLILFIFGITTFIIIKKR